MIDELEVIPDLPDDIKNDPKALYDMLGAVVYNLQNHFLKFPSKDLKNQYTLQMHLGDDQSVVFAAKVVPEWGPEGDKVE
ncbi:hypothetical protein [Arthrobacter sp. NPDC056727]|uniref:hypothetical protein n=1 Tax=Arthrobacter sp. NPDC056727 TaxID=3345927 RepID=UPI0036718874